MSINENIKKQIVSTINNLKNLWGLAPKKTGVLAAVAVGSSLGI